MEIKSFIFNIDSYQLNSNNLQLSLRKQIYKLSLIIKRLYKWSINI